jgi:general secretion pathway protein C
MKENFLDKLKTQEFNFLSDPDVVARIISALRTLLIIASLGLAVVIVRVLLDTKVSEVLDNTLVSSTTTPLPEIQAPVKTSKNYSKIVDRNLFGAITPTGTSAQTTPAAKPISKLPLQLIGIYISDEEGAYSIIENQKNKEQDVFVIGDKIFNEASLVAIKPDSVEINRNGEIETLILEALPTVGKPPPGSGGVMNISETEFVVDRVELDNQLSNLSMLLQQARAVPSYKNGEAVGLRVFAIRPDSLFSKIGLRNGDVLLNINGRPLSDLTEAIKMFEVMKSESSFTVLLERNRESKEFTYQVR